MNRRGFLSALFGAAAAPALDPERLLWVPGRRRIFIPRPELIPRLSLRWISSYDYREDRFISRIDAIYGLQRLTIPRGLVTGIVWNDPAIEPQEIPGLMRSRARAAIDAALADRGVVYGFRGASHPRAFIIS